MRKSAPDHSAANDIAVVLFDLGGVLLRLGDTATTFGLASEEREFHRTWILSHAVREFERGAIDFEEFASRIVDELALPYGADEFLERFNRWPEKLFTGVPELLGQLQVAYRVALLSNTNAVHWQRPDVAGVLEPMLDHAFLSFRTGLLKPDTDAFGQVLVHYECAARQILFLDDNPLNIEAANSIGMRACLARGMDDVRRELSNHGVIA